MGVFIRFIVSMGVWVCAASHALALPQPLIEFGFDEPGTTQRNTGTAPFELTLIHPDGAPSELIDEQEGAGVSGNSKDLCLVMSQGSAETGSVASGARVDILSDMEVFTLSGWIKDSPVQNEFSARIIGNVPPGNLPNGFLLTLTGTQLSLQVSGELIHSNGVYDFSAPEWKFWAVTYDGNLGKASFYLFKLNEGAVEYTVEASTGRASASEGTLLIANDSSGTRPLVGRIDNIRVFNHILSRAQLEQLMERDLNRD